MLFALSTGHKVGLLTFALIFVAFALLSAFVLPRFRPQFPGRGLPLFVLVTIGLFAAMLTAVIVFGREGKEAEAKPGTPETTVASGARKVVVDEMEFKITLPGGSTLTAGSYDFEAKNTGKIAHDLVIDGPGVKDAKTPVFDSGQTESLKVTLQPGTYDFYCSVPGHKQAGMDLKVKVS